MMCVICCGLRYSMPKIGDRERNVLFLSLSPQILLCLPVKWDTIETYRILEQNDGRCFSSWPLLATDLASLKPTQLPSVCDLWVLCS